MSSVEPPPLPLADGPETPYQPTQEVRFAVVMFGGISLAIYMNGISQELMRMVEATAPQGPYDPDPANQGPLLGPHELASTRSVYRTVGRMVRHRLAPLRLDDVEANPRVPVLSRFVVDILSGTSAGGINAVYLAKGLACQQNPDVLAGLWTTKGDIDKLLNDGPRRLRLYGGDALPTALLNGRWMYRELYAALGAMDRTAPERSPDYASPLVDELDLYVTATDLLGYWAPVKTSDRLIDERIHKHVFHFRYAPGGWDRPNDFHRSCNGMLAFAARCTSSFPVAFEPMTLDDVAAPTPLPGFDTTSPDWRRFFQPYLKQGAAGQAYSWRQFADGGYLQNKPFSHALRGIRFRRAEVPVDRKLLFLDPFPEDAPGPSAGEHRVGFAENLVLAASSLPRYQAIREDLDAVNSRNRLLYRARVLRERLLGNGRNRPNWQSLGRIQFCATDVDTLIADRGAPFASYFYLRLYDLTDQLALLVTRMLGFADDSDEFRAVRHLVRAWRENHYCSNLGPDDDDAGLRRDTEFLVRYDLSYRERRADFLLSALDDELYRLRAVIDAPEGPPAGSGRTIRDEVALLLRMRRQIRRGLHILHNLRGELWSPPIPGGPVTDHQQWLRDALEPLAGDDLRLAYIMAPADEQACYLRAREVLDGRRDAAVGAAVRALGELLEPAFRDSRGALDDALALDDDEPAPWSSALDDALDQFDFYDSLLYPTLASLDLGERDVVQTYRIGPADATHTRTAFQRLGESKLAGTALAAFGGFLRQEWRSNDIMWGRLDGAERLLYALLPGDEPALREDRRQLVERAHRIIIDELFTPQDQEQFLRLLGLYLRRHADILAPSAPTGTSKKPPAVDEVVAWLKQTGQDHRGEIVAMLLQNALASEGRIDLFRRAYRLPDPPRLDQTMGRLRRASRIFGAMLRGMGSDRSVVAKVGAALGLLGPALGWLIELSVPSTRLGRWRTRLVAAMLAASGLLLASGYLYWEKDIAAGWRWLGLTMVLSAVLLSIEWLFLPRAAPGARRWSILGGLAAAAAALGALRWYKLLPTWWPTVAAGALAVLLGASWIAGALRRRRDRGRAEAAD